MSLELPEFLSDAQIFNRRFLIGIFFPTFTEILFLQLILHKEIPSDFNPILVLAAIAVGISLVLERFAGRMIWIGAFCGRHYRKERKSFFEEKTSEKTKLSSLLISNYIEDLEKKARGSYLTDFWDRRSHYDLEALGRRETDFLLAFLFLIYGLGNFFLINYLAHYTIDLEIFTRDTIDSSNLIFLISTLLFIWIVFFSLYLFQKQIQLTRRIFTNLPVPYREVREDWRETKCYIQSMEALLQSHPEGSPIYEANRDLILQFYQRQFQRELIDQSAIFLAEELSEALPEQIRTEKRLDEKQEAQLREVGDSLLVQEMSQQRIERSISIAKIEEIAELYATLEENYSEFLDDSDWVPEDAMAFENIVMKAFNGFEHLNREAFGISRVSAGLTVNQFSELWGITTGEAEILISFTKLKNQLTQIPWDPNTPLEEIKRMKQLTKAAIRQGEVLCALLLAQEESCTN